MLEAKHKNFVAPGFEIEVDGKKLPLDKFAIMNLQINIPVTVGLRSMVSEASQCQFTVAGMYDLKNHKFTESALETLKMGKKIVINGGYSTKSCLFVGYIQYVSTDFFLGWGLYHRFRHRFVHPAQSGQAGERL